MDHRGHPKNPNRRDELPLHRLVTSFIEETREEDPGLVKHLEPLKGPAIVQLGGVLVRFDQNKKGELGPAQRLFARRILSRIHRPSDETLLMTNRILDYLDLDQNALLDEAELELGVQVLELFAAADSKNDTLSHIELEMLYATLRHLDSDDNGKLDPHEKDQLVRGLGDPELFLAQQKASNPLFREVIAQHKPS